MWTSSTKSMKKAQTIKEAAPLYSESSIDRVRFGANQSLIFIRIRVPLTPRSDGESKLRQMSRSVVLRKPRSYKHQRKEQTLRHTASVVKSILDSNNVRGYQEVQVGVKGRGTVFISTNTNLGNKYLRDKLSKYSLKTLAEHLSSDRVASTLAPVDGGRHIRVNRHVKKFITRVPSLEEDWAQNSIQIPNPVDKQEDGLHAERRIKRAMGIEGPLPREVSIKGIRRPCAHCFGEMQYQGGVSVAAGPGPMWGSQAASMGNVLPSTRVTHLTEDRNGGITFDHDSDSDSDADI